MPSVTKAMARGAAWMFAARWVDKVLGLASTLVLARLLVPADFGLVAIATAVIAFLGLLANFSFEIALIQHPSPSREHYDTVWTIGLLFGTAIAGTLVALAYPLAYFYNDPRLAPIMPVLALSSFIGSLRNIGCIDFSRDLHFHKEFLLSLYRRVLTVPITLVLAFWLRDYWALILGSLLTSAIGTVLTYAMHSFRPRWSLLHKAELFGFSKWLFLLNIYQFISLRAGDFIIGKLRGPHELGLFTMANEFGSLPATELVAPINRAAFSGYARLASDRARLINVYLQVMGLVALVALPVGVGIALTAELFVPLLLGSKWTDAIALLQLLALAGAAVALWSNTGYVFLALGQPRKVAMLSGCQAATTVVFLLGFLLTDVPNGVGWAMLAAASAFAVPNLYLWRTDLGIAWRRALSGLWRPAIGCVGLAVAVPSLQVLLGPSRGIAEQAVALGACIAVGAVVYATLVFGAWWLCGKPAGPEKYVLDLARR
jgi:O-antigen/teichoic acid export membrane protein